MHRFQRTPRSRSAITPGSRPARYLASLLVLLALCAGLQPGRATPAALAQAQPGTQQLVLGALLSLTGDGATLGNASRAVLARAVADINTEFAAAGNPVRVSLAVEDTGQDPDRALQSGQALAARGVKLVVGPQTSSEVRAISPWVNANGVILLSQGSTASSLSQRQDNVLRFVPDDTHETAAIAALMQNQGVQAVVPMWRGDVGNDGLHASFLQAFPNAAAAVSPGVRYDPTTSDFSAALADLSSQVSAAEAQVGSGAVAVYLASFEEAVRIFQLAAGDPVLSGVRWFGTDGVASSSALLADPTAAAFAMSVGFPAPDLGLPAGERARWQPIAADVEATLGSAPNAYALTTYDIAWVAALASLETGGTASPAALRAAIVNTAGRYHGVTGDTTLNASGDRASGSYDFVAIRPMDAGPEWVHTFSYDPSLGITAVQP